VASIVLAYGVVLYGASLFEGGTQSEAITVYKIKLWVHNSAPEGLGWGAVGLRNTGDVETAIDTIRIRGVDIPFSNWYADSTISNKLIQKALNHTGWSGSNGMIKNDDPDSLCNELLAIDLDGAGGELPVCAGISAGPTTIIPGQNVIIYFKILNGTVISLDSGSQIGVGIFSSKAVIATSIVLENPR
jgi:hypothetical protein